jgi:mRNA-degrading endonuclease RelE of RelBE toxin-antitoxin system
MEVKGTPRFERMLKRLHPDQQYLVLERASELRENPFTGKRLTGPLAGLYSLRIGDYRLLYYIDRAAGRSSHQDKKRRASLHYDSWL